MTNYFAPVKRILVVDDEPSIILICQRVLVKEGFEVDTASDGRTAQDMIDNNKYDFLLLDLRTPVMSGQELYHWITEKHPEIAEKVTFTTGDVMRADTQTFLDNTGRPYLPKPFSPSQIRNTIREATRQPLQNVARN
jgi:DNA-binding response OmpR family regulator